MSPCTSQPQADVEPTPMALTAPHNHITRNDRNRWKRLLGRYVPCKQCISSHTMYNTLSQCTQPTTVSPSPTTLLGHTDAELGFRPNSTRMPLTNNSNVHRTTNQQQCGQNGLRIWHGSPMRIKRPHGTLATLRWAAIIL